jgi:hypothetical protein
MSSNSTIIKRIHVGDLVQAHCGRCKDERSHSIVSLKENGKIDTVTCRTCYSSHRFKSITPTSKSKSPRVTTTVVRSVKSKESSPYSPQKSYAKGETLLHSKFGEGKVLEVRGDKMEVKFDDEVRTLIHSK